MNKNIGKILCNNMLLNGKCSYGDKCLYAHSLEKQVLEPLREQAYSIIKSKSNINNVDLQKDYKLYRVFLEMTKICDQCKINKCTGGLNCKKGVADSKYQICINDLNYGNCINPNCKLVHLTKFNIYPFYIKQNDVNRDKIINDPSDDDTFDIVLSSSSDDEKNDYDISIF